MHRIAILGLGAMGVRMAANLTKAGHDLVVWNRSPGPVAKLRASGARVAATPRTAAEEADFVISMVRDDAASRAVWLDDASGALGGLHPDALAIECSTVTPAWVAELASAIQGRSSALLDAPVVGSRPQAEAGQLIFLVGGDGEAVAQALPLMEAMGGAIHHAGPSGSGAAVKLAVNALLSVQASAVAELLAFLTRSGLDPARSMGILAGMPVVSPAAAGLAKMMVARSFAPMFPMALVEKDLGYALAGADRVGADLPTTRAVRDVFARALACGYGGDNISGVVQVFE